MQEEILQLYEKIKDQLSEEEFLEEIEKMKQSIETLLEAEQEVEGDIAIIEEVIEDKIGQKLYLSPGMTDESVSLVYCTCSGKISDENLEDDEDIETILLSKEDAIKSTEKLPCNSLITGGHLDGINTMNINGEITIKKPKTNPELAEIVGVGEIKAQRFGEVILPVIISSNNLVYDTKKRAKMPKQTKKQQ